MEFMEKILKKGRCCICATSLIKSKHVHVFILEKKQTWEFPSVGNVLYDTEKRASSIICDKCVSSIDETDFHKKIKYAIELQNDEILYYEVETLEDTHS